MRLLLALGVLASVLGSAPAARAVGSCGSQGETGTRVSVEHEASLYYVTTPADYSPDQPWPLIIGLHGDEGDPAMSVNYFWRTVPDGTFIFVAPKAPNATGSWYAEQESNSAWMDSLVASLLARYNVDLDRVYLWGLSGGAVFSSRYVIDRQDVFAAVEFNMGGSGRQYQEPEPPACKIPARFVVSTTDFLRESALGFYDLLVEHEHEAVWVDADCQDHCFDQEQAGPVARDWLLSHTLCGHTPSAGCLGGGAGTGAGGSAGAGSSGSNGASAAGGSTAGMAAAGQPGGGGVTGTASAGAAGSGASGPGASGAPGNPTATDTAPSAEAGCACATPGARPSPSVGISSLFLLALLARRRLLRMQR